MICKAKLVPGFVSDSWVLITKLVLPVHGLEVNIEPLVTGSPEGTLQRDDDWGYVMNVTVSDPGGQHPQVLENKTVSVDVSNYIGSSGIRVKNSFSGEIRKVKKGQEFSGF